jgi:hypothetical protein
MSTRWGAHGQRAGWHGARGARDCRAEPKRQLLRLGSAAATVTGGAFRLGAASVAGPAEGLPSCVRPPRSARSRPEVASVTYHPVDVRDAGRIRVAVGTCSDARPPRAIVDCAASRPSMRIANNHGVHDLDLYVLRSPGGGSRAHCSVASAALGGRDLFRVLLDGRAKRPAGNVRSWSAPSRDHKRLHGDANKGSAASSGSPDLSTLQLTGCRVARMLRAPPERSTPSPGADDRRSSS